MPDARAAGRRPPVILAVLLTVIAPVLAYASVRSALYEATRFRVDVSSFMPPPSPLPELRRVMADARPGRRAPGPRALQVAGRAAVRYPLAFEPYYIAGRVAEREGRYPEAIRLMEEAKRRRPNFLPTRLQLLSYYSLTNAYQQAIDEADASIRVRPAAALGQLMPAFVRLVAEDERARRAIAVVLARRPAWEGEFFRVAAERGMAPTTAFSLIEEVGRLSGGRPNPVHEQFLIQILVRAGDYARARSFWERGRTGRAQASTLVTDEKFGGETPPPFGWNYHATADGVAERIPARGGEPAHLEVSYFGGADAPFADQTLVLKPGRYRLSSRARVDSSARDVGLSWFMNCLPDRSRLATLSLPVRAEPGTSAVDVQVPGRCAAVELLLAGTPGDLPRALTAQVFEVSLRPVAATGSRP